MDSRKVKINGEADESLLSAGTFLLLYHAEMIPPHIMLLHEGYYYSLSVRGSEIRNPLSKLIRRIHQTKAKVVFIGLQVPDNSPDPSSWFMRYEAPEEGKTTCLFPIREFIGEVSALDLTGCRFVFELFEELVNNQLITESYHFYLEDLAVKNNYFYFPVYSAKEIDKCIWFNRLTSPLAERK